MKLSVIVPIYNTQDFLAKCIESVLSQTYTDFELILVVDGSTDNSLHICKQYELTDDRVIVLNKPNGGSTSCRKAAANIARGDYIVCIDSDDFVDNEYFMYISKVIAEYGVDIISFGIKTYMNNMVIRSFDFVPQGLYVGEDYERVKSNFIFDKNKRGFNFGTLNYSLCRKVIKKEIYAMAQMSVNDIIVMGEDMLCFAHVLHNSKTLYVSDKCFYNYIIHGDSITRHNIVDNFKHFNNTVVAMQKSNIITEEQISVYSYNAILNLITALAKMSKSYHEFIVELKNTFQNKELFDMARRVRWLDGRSIKEKLLALLINNKKYRCVYLIYNRK